MISMSRSIPTNLSCSVGPYLQHSAITTFSQSADNFTKQPSSCNQYWHFVGTCVYNTSDQIKGRCAVKIPVVEEEFFTRLDCSLGKDTNTMIAIDHHYLGITVWIDWVVCKTDLVALTCRIHHEICTTLKYYTQKLRKHKKSGPD